VHFHLQTVYSAYGALTRCVQHVFLADTKCGDAGSGPGASSA